MQSVKQHRFLILLFILFAISAAVFSWKFNIINRDDLDIIMPIKSTKIEKENVTLGLSRISSGIYPENEAEASESAFNTHLFESLVTFDKDNRIKKVLVTNWINPDDLTWRFSLSPKAKFSNGDPVTAEDVKFTYDYILKNKLPVMSYLPEATLNVGDSRTIEFKTKSPDPLLLNRLATGFLILSKKEVEANGLKNHIGSGQYILVEKTDEYIKIKRNESYWGKKPKIKNVTFRAMPKEEDRIAALLNGETDFLSYGFSTQENTEKVEQAVTQGKIQKRQILDNAVYFISLDTTKDKTPYINTPQNPLKDLRVRKAIYQAINMDKIAEDTSWTSMTSATQLVSSGIFGYNPSIKRLSYDPTEAKRLMAEAGYEKGFDLTLDYMAAPHGEDPLKPIVEQLAAINIKVTLNGLDGEKYFPKVTSGDTSAFTVGWSADTMDAGEVLQSLVHTPTESLGSANISYSNKNIDQLIDDAAQTINQRTRQQKLQEAMRLAMADVAKVPLFQFRINWAISNDIFWSPRIDGGIRVYEMAGKAS